MIIRNQQKTLILKMDCISNIYTIKHGSEFRIITDGNTIGTYSTEQKAIKVLDMICEHMDAMYFSEIAPDKTIHLCSHIFNMPQDYEVQIDDLICTQKSSIMEIFMNEIIDKLKEERNKTDSATRRPWSSAYDFISKKEAFDKSVNIIEQIAEKYKDCALIHTGGLDEGIRCAMCTNSMKSETGCDGGCVVNDEMYKKVLDVINRHSQI